MSTCIKKILILLLVTAITLSVPVIVYADDVWDGTVADSFAGGSGTKGDPYLIATGAQLAHIGQTGYYLLISDIYLNDVSDWESWTEDNAPENTWTPLLSELHFQGVFDGNGHSIHGMYINKTDKNAGLFAFLNGATIKNLSIVRSKVFGTTYAAAFAGNCTNSEFINCVNEADIKASTSAVGGIAGGTEGNSLIISCINRGKINVTDSQNNTGNNIGGIVGRIYQSVVSDCANYQMIESSKYRVGGIVGGVNTDDCVVNNCTNTGAISGSYQVGGIIGWAQGTIDHCYNSGDVKGLSSSSGLTGGIVGSVSGSVRNCLNSGKVTCSGQNCGGIVGGSSGSVFNSINTGSIQCYQWKVGGICGSASEKVYNCVNAGSVSGINGSIASIVGGSFNCDISHCFYQTGCCEYDVSSDEIVELSEDEIRNDSTLEILNDWVQAQQRPYTGYHTWVAGDDGLPKLDSSVAPIIPVLGNLTLHQPEHGSASISVDAAMTDDQITVTINADSDAIPLKVTVVASERPDVEITAERDGNIFTFSMPYGDADVYASCLQVPEAQVWDGTKASSFAGGSGTKNDPYLIATGAQLAHMRDIPSTSYYCLIADIYMNDTSELENWSRNNAPKNRWVPLALMNDNFDGGGHTIYGLYINYTSRTGLFSVISGGSLKNLSIKQSKVFGTYQVGAFAGHAWNSSITGCYNEADVTGSEEDVGGIVGGLYLDAVVSDCTNNGNIISTGGYRVGGIVGGISRSSSFVYNCVNMGKVTGPDYVGGIVGLSWGAVALCANYGPITASKTSSGGIIGECDVANGEALTIRNCFNTGIITADSKAGGLIGQCAISHDSSSITLENCYSTGVTSGSDRVSGITGFNYTNPNTTITFRNCYCLTGASSALVSTYGDGNIVVVNNREMSDSEMRMQSSFEGFDFNNVWYMPEGGYPEFKKTIKAQKLGSNVDVDYMCGGCYILLQGKKTSRVILGCFDRGQMTELRIVEISAGESIMLTPKDWNREIKLLCIADGYVPLCTDLEIATQ